MSFTCRSYAAVFRPHTDAPWPTTAPFGRARQDLQSTVYAFPSTGVGPLRAAYRALITHLGDADAVVPVDGGTDILMRGDEHGPGTPEEGKASLAAVSRLDEIPHRRQQQPRENARLDPVAADVPFADA